MGEKVYKCQFCLYGASADKLKADLGCPRCRAPILMPLRAKVVWTVWSAAFLLAGLALALLGILIFGLTVFVFLLEGHWDGFYPDPTDAVGKTFSSAADTG